MMSKEEIETLSIKQYMRSLNVAINYLIKLMENIEGKLNEMS